MINTKKARTIVLFLSIVSVLICCLGLNLMGGFAFLNYENYTSCGYALLISSVLLVIAFIFAALKKVIIPIVFNLSGTIAYVYTLAFLNAIPNTKIPKESIDILLIKHYPTIAVTVFLALLVFFNYMGEDAVKKRTEKKQAKNAAENRQLNDNERIV